MMNGRLIIVVLGLLGVALIVWGTWLAFSGGGPKSLVASPEEAHDHDMDTAHPEATAEHPLTVGFHDPKEGQVIEGGEVFVWVMFHAIEKKASFELVPPDGTRAPERGHFALVLDQKLTLDPNQPIAAGPLPQSGIWHTHEQYITLKGVPPGEHTLTAILVDGAHFPLWPPIKATVRFKTQ